MLASGRASGEEAASHMWLIVLHNAPPDHTKKICGEWMMERIVGVFEDVVTSSVSASSSVRSKIISDVETYNETIAESRARVAASKNSSIAALMAGMGSPHHVHDHDVGGVASPRIAQDSMRQDFVRDLMRAETQKSTDESTILDGLAIDREEEGIQKPVPFGRKSLAIPQRLPRLRLR
jgi:hypothetical protein